MVKLYGTKVSDCTEKNIIESLTKLVSDERRERIKRFVFQKDAIRSLLGEIIARYAVSRHLDCKSSEINFSVDSFNKPFLDKADSIYFNISHSGNWVVCAISNNPVGIDVEIIKETDFEIAKRFFAKDEYEKIMNQPIDNRTKYFYLMWTLKESYIKADGRGLSLPLDSFSIMINNDTITLSTGNELTNCHFKQFEIDDSHIVSVCTQESCLANEIKIITANDMLTSLTV